MKIIFKGINGIFQVHIADEQIIGPIFNTSNLNESIFVGATCMLISLFLPSLSTHPPALPPSSLAFVAALYSIYNQVLMFHVVALHVPQVTLVLAYVFRLFAPVFIIFFLFFFCFFSIIFYIFYVVKPFTSVIQLNLSDCTPDEPFYCTDTNICVANTSLCITHGTRNGFSCLGDTVKCYDGSCKVYINLDIYLFIYIYYII
jgi:hypothetical protein